MSERKRAVVQEVTDGDTFSTSVRIRLARVEAPELGQPNGTVAKKKLESLILGKEVVYEPVGRSYDRIVAEVWQNGSNICDQMIRFLNNL